MIHSAIRPSLPALISFFAIILVTSTAAVAQVQPAAASSVQGVKWLRSAAQAAAEAQRTGKPILIYVRSKTCHYCDLMQRDVWQNREAAQTIMANFVPLKLTREENAEAVKAMKVKGFPSTLIFSPKREYLGRLDGYMPADRFLAAIRPKEQIDR